VPAALIPVPPAPASAAVIIIPSVVIISPAVVVVSSFPAAFPALIEVDVVPLPPLAPVVIPVSAAVIIVSPVVPVSPVVSVSVCHLHFLPIGFLCFSSPALQALPVAVGKNSAPVTRVIPPPARPCGCQGHWVG